jgi:hypothetical protein
MLKTNSVGISPSQKPMPNPAVILFFGLFILWGFGWSTLVARLRDSVDGTVVERRDIPSEGTPRYVSEYTIKASDGSIKTYVAGPTDASLPRSLPVGTRLKKVPWQLSYEQDGQPVDERSMLFFYVPVLSLASGCVIWGTQRLFRDRSPL